MSRAGSERAPSPAAPPRTSGAPSVVPPAPVSSTGRSKAKNDAFYDAWDKFYSPPPPRNRSVTPSLDVDVENHPAHPTRRNTQGLISSEPATNSFDSAATTCRKKVAAIVAECCRLNVKYTDPLFNPRDYDALSSLASGEYPASVNPKKMEFVGTVKRIHDIFEDPKFVVDGATINDVRQGSAGNCWFLAAVTALSGTEEPGQSLRLVDRICIARDEKVGVYGFVFHRDGEWISEVIDDRLAISESPESLESKDKKVRHLYSKGSESLYFASCRDSNETWLPLLEKAYAKAHGDYQSIEGGLSGEGIEDLTGGVSTSILTEDILDEDILWSELQRVNTDFLFGCSSRRALDTTAADADAEGFVRGHAYTVLEAREIDGHRLLKLRNPWGNQEWKGAWADGSKEWTPDRLKAAEHVFGDDGIFWISFADFPTYYPRMDRTRLFDPQWTVTQQWTSVEVPYNVEYLDTKFSVDVRAPGPLVIVLAIPDERYFNGLDGRHVWDLHFRLYRDGEDTYLLRSMGGSGLGRSTSAEFEATPGKYHIFFKIRATRYDSARTAEEAIKFYRRPRRDKLLAVGKNFDKIHSKGLLREAETARAEQAKKSTKAEAQMRKVDRMKKERVFRRETRRKLHLQRARAKEEALRKKGMKQAAFEKKAAEAAAAKKEKNEASAQGGTDEDEGKLVNGGEPEPHASIDSLAATTGKLSVNDTITSPPNEIAPLKAEDAPSPVTAVPNPVPEDVDPRNADPDASDRDADSGSDAASVISSVASSDFSWSSDIDEPLTPLDEASESDSDDDIFSDDPWNAICVVGLRVYSKGGGVKIRVVKEDKGGGVRDGERDEGAGRMKWMRDGDEELGGVRGGRGTATG